MRVTSLGHAALYVETDDQRILIDPVFASALVGGALTYHPARRLDLERLPKPTALVVTHGHFDHFHAASLEGLSKDLTVITAEDPRLIETLRALGFSRIIPCAPWQIVELGKTRVVPTPSGHDEPEFGVVIAHAGGAFWHMADAETTPADGARVVREHGPIALVSAKYQPVVRASMGHLRTRGASFDKAEVASWLEAACAVDPQFIFPFASGLCFAGRHAWFNRYAFPYSPEEIAHLLQRRLGAGRADVLNPGDVVDVLPGQAPRRHAQAAPFVAMAASEPILWEPIDTSTLEGLGSASERQDLETRLDAFLGERLMPWLRRELGSAASPLQQHRAQQVVWQLVVETGQGERIERYVDYCAEPLEASPGRHAYANAFTHVSGRALRDVLRGEAPALLFWLTGEARSYEKAIAITESGLVARPLPAPEDELGDPLTYFLRQFGPNAEGKTTTPVAIAGERVEPSEIEVLLRQGENRAVAEKKALLSLLASREAERLGIAITDADVQATSDDFRVRFDLAEPAQTAAWLREVGLDVASYIRVMRAFTAVRLVQARLAAEVEEFVDSHTKIAAARRRSR